MEEDRVAERKVLNRQSSTSLRLVNKGDHRRGYIEHSSERYLVARGRNICCEPLQAEDQGFEHFVATYPAMDDEKAINDDEPIFLARTFSRQDQSTPGTLIYLSVTKEKTILLQEVDLPDSPKVIPDNEELVFFRIRSLPHEFVCFESTEFEMNFLAVEEDNRVCLKPLPDYSVASETPTVQFKVNYIH